MPRLYEVRRHDLTSDLLALVDLEKVYLVRIEKESGHHYQHLLIRFSDGHEVRDLVPPEAAQRFLDAYREYLNEASPRPGASGS